ncbi:hypothetical protein [Haloferula sargassicola]|uniref:Methyltransferase FkbM domain-containing protein n=1 Tax=Haloferula sargassicola TaxID=490096 RepID=A0ABP9UIG8_9BACT
MKKLALNLPSKFAFYPTKLTPRDELLALLRDLRPLETEHPLIRLGGDGDGGYLLPDDLDGLAACFSPGVDVNSSFEFDCADRGMEVFMVDASVEGPAARHERFHFQKKFIGSFTEDPYISMQDWVDSTPVAKDGDLLLQMDIEGYEWETLFSMSTALMSRFRIIVIELHKLENLFSDAIFPILSRCLRKLLHTHDCVHIHPNNIAPMVRSRGLEIPWYGEFTFLRKDRISQRKPATRFPHPLDRDCEPDEPSMVLPKEWWN